MRMAGVRAREIEAGIPDDVESPALAFPFETAELVELVDAELPGKAQRRGRILKLLTMRRVLTRFLQHPRTMPRIADTDAS